MKLVVNLKLSPTPAQANILKQTLETSNQACNYLSQRGWDAKILRQYDLHKLAYHDTKREFGLAADMVVRCIAKVADAYKTGRATRRTFRPHAAQPYNHHILSFKKGDIASIWTIAGRLPVQCVMGAYQRQLFAHRKGEIDLLYIDRVFYLACVCDIDDPALMKTRDVLGVDVGIVNLATDSNGKNYTGKAVRRVRMTFAHRRRNLQRKRTRSATRKLVKIAKKQARFQRDTNHCISKSIVRDAQRTESAIALEDLTGIRTRVTARRHQRARLTNWAFAQLQFRLEYKARRAGVPVLFVDPRHTSQTCPACGHVAKANRKTRDLFRCAECGLAGPADAIAARNIRARAIINSPMVAMDCALQHGSSVTNLAL